MLGIGGKADKLVHVDRSAKDGVGLLRRFSGGGTVIVDQDSLFATFIMNTVCVESGWRLERGGNLPMPKRTHTPDVADHTKEETTPGEPYPRPIMQWTATVYGPVFQRVAVPETEVRRPVRNSG